MLRKISLITLLLCTFLSAENNSTIIFKGSGATFPFPLYQKWFEEFAKTEDIKIIYDPVGSGQGIDDFLHNRVDFAGTDVFLKDEELEKINYPVVHVPTCIGAIVFTYNLPVNKPINISKQTLLKILTGKISNWNNYFIQQENPGMKFPDLPITLIHRSDESGSTYVLTKYLSKISLDWNKKFGYGKSINWELGLGVEGNRNIAKYVTKIEGSIGYLSFTYAKNNDLPIAKIENENANFILPTVKSIQKSAEIEIPNDVRIDLVASSNKNSYPICTFSYLIYANKNNNPDTALRYKLGKEFFQWMLTKGQKYNSNYYYAPVPINVAEKIYKIIN